MVRHLVSAADLSIQDLEWFWQHLNCQADTSQVLVGTPVTLVFDTPSTRTMLAFCKAAIDLGATPIVVARERSRLSSGETIQDTIRTVAAMVGGIVVVRGNTPTKDLVDDVAIVNAGDIDEHPTQAIVDLCAIARSQDVTLLSQLREFRLAVFAGAGALFRPIVSLIHVLQTLRIGSLCVICESPDDATELKRQQSMEHCDIFAFDSPSPVEDVDLIYVLESYDSGEQLRNSEWLRAMLSFHSHAAILHPLPRSESSVCPMAQFRSSLVETQLALHVPARRAILAWVAHSAGPQYGLGGGALRDLPNFVVDRSRQQARSR